MGLSLSENLRGGLRKYLLIGMTLAIAGMGGAAAAWYLKKPPLSPEVVSDLEASPEKLNFGEVWEDSQFSIVLPITNHQTHDIEIKRFLKSCNCSQIEPPSLTIPAGETREVRVTLDLAPRKAEELGKSVRDFEVGISPELSGATDRGKRISWTIRGRARSAIQFDPPFMDFGRVSELASPPPSQRAIIKTFVPLQDITATCSSSLFEVKTERRSMKESDPIDLIVRPHRALPKGEIRCTVALKAVIADGERLPEKQLRVVGRVVGDIEASLPSVTFGACPVGTTVEETIALRSLTGSQFIVTDMRCEGSGLSVKRVDEASTALPTFRIDQKIGAMGEQQGKVTFAVRPNGRKEDEVRIVISYCGIEAGTKRALSLQQSAILSGDME